MSAESPYKELRKALERAGGAIPALDMEELYRLLEELVTPEEASLGAVLPGAWVTAAAQARTMGRPGQEVASLLESMTNKGFLHARKNAHGHYEYRLMPLLPGIYEMQFYRGTKTERDYRIARLFKDLLDAMNRLRASLPTPPPVPKTSYFRVLPVEKEIGAATEVLPYAKISRYVAETEAIAAGTCFCRHHAILVDEKDDCGVSHNNCLAFGEGAVFVADRKMGRLISKEEALDILAKSEQEGLVHCSANTSEELAFICNCCSCHCGILRQAKRVPHASQVLTSGYNAMVDADLCTGCETCTGRCPVSAITVDGTACVDPLQCIGCGLCVSTCPTEAIQLVVRPEGSVPPARMGHLEAAMKKR